MTRQDRRGFLRDVGKGMLVAGIGAALAEELELASACADAPPDRLLFGDLEPLVSLMQESSPDALIPKLVDAYRNGTNLQQMITAGALANARTFGGQDYIGFHTFMALAPAYRMAQLLPKEKSPLPVLKVLYRNSQRIQAFGGASQEILHPVSPAENAVLTGEALQAMTRRGDMEGAERLFATMSPGQLGEAFNHLQYAVEDEVDVHRVVLAWRGWDMLEFAGASNAHTLLRQSVRYCVKSEQDMVERQRSPSPIRELLPRLLVQYKLLDRTLGNRKAEDEWIDRLAEKIFRSTREEAAEEVAGALAEGFDPSEIGEALSIASNRLLLHDPGRPPEWSNADKPVGSCHGDSVGVHASDAANAWRSIVRVSDARNVVASLIVGAFHTAGQSGRSRAEPLLTDDAKDAVASEPAERLLDALADAIEQRDQVRSMALAARYAAAHLPPEPLRDVCLRYAVSEEGALHAEKYFQTVQEEFKGIRSRFRWNQFIGLARVTASEFGFRSAGFEEAQRLLG